MTQMELCGIIAIMLYTGKGDKGTTKFFDTPDGERISKNSAIARTLGSLDEINSFLGFCKVKAEKAGLRAGTRGPLISHILEEVQQNLFIAQAEAAGAQRKIVKKKVAQMEALIDIIEKEIPPITEFSIPGGTELSALLDTARAMARDTERQVIVLCDDLGEIKLCGGTRAYLNRLSSLLFALARLANHKSGIKEKHPDYK